MGTDKDKSQVTAAELRRRAEGQLKAKTPEAGLSRRDDETQRLLHELQVHQVELEMQNAELRQARDELEAALEKYTDLYDFAPVGYFTLDRDGVILSVNHSGSLLLGTERSRLLGRNFQLLLPDNSRQLFLAFLRKVFSGQGKEICEVTLSMGGNTSFVHVEGVSAMSGQECRIASIDITGRRHAEQALTDKKQELEELNRTLESRIVESVEELRRKDEMLIIQDRLAVMGEMINNIAHQWRQPLNTLGLLIQQMPLQYASGQLSREFVEENSVREMELIQHMSRTIDDFRNFFRSDKVAVAFPVSQVITQMLSLIEKSLKDLGIAVDLHQEGDPTLTGYPNEYAQVLLNILMNARDALVGHSVRDARISVHVLAERGKAVVTITDNAGGIPEEIIDRIFDPYFTTKGPDKGTGIGLFMSKVIVEKNMGGRLNVRNTGTGAEFRIEV